jgi:hypothetical protein
MDDGGYDIADHCAVDPLFGTLADFDALIDDAHERGLRMIVDLVPNHTSDRFQKSRSSTDNPKRDLPRNTVSLPGRGARLEDGVVPPERVVDLDGRDPERSPLSWDTSPGAQGTIAASTDMHANGSRVSSPLRLRPLCCVVICLEGTRRPAPRRRSPRPGLARAPAAPPFERDSAARRAHRSPRAATAT